MPLRLLLLRHLKSSRDSPTPDDRDRPLSKRGRKAGPLVRAFLASRGPVPDAVVCSTALRARQTLELVRAALGGAAERFEDRVYEATREALAGVLREESAPTLLLVGHNPGMEELATWLTEGNPGNDGKARGRMEDKYPTGALALLECDADTWGEAVKKGAWRVVRFTTPKELGAEEE
ncbi:phosphoglycerate mutase family protein [Hyaloraphidium curvatum]|nr:phosphoglycerate mutase family protein [Hyaloraphidium curvatum]